MSTKKSDEKYFRSEIDSARERLGVLDEERAELVARIIELEKEITY